MLLKELGRQYEKAGVIVIDKILTVMNRLSTSKIPDLDRKLLSQEIDSLLRGPSNLERKANGQIYIKSLNRFKAGVSSRRSIKVQIQDQEGKILENFATIKSCAAYLGVDPS